MINRFSQSQKYRKNWLNNDLNKIYISRNYMNKELKQQMYLIFFEKEDLKHRNILTQQ